MRRSHDFRRVTDVTASSGRDGDTLYRMPASLLDELCQRISIPTSSVETNLQAINLAAECSEFVRGTNESWDVQ